MDPTRFDSFTRALTDANGRNPSRRSLFAILGGGLVAAGLAPVMESDARRRRRKRHHRGRRRHKPGRGGGTLGKRELCDPGGAKTCQAGLSCDAPTVHHTCSDTVGDIDNWCCVPAGLPCSRDIDECECCAGSYCEYDDNNEPHCLPDPDAN